MTTFGEALEAAGVVARRAMVEAMKAGKNEDETTRLADIAFFQSLEASGFKIIGPKPTAEQRRVLAGPMNAISRDAVVTRTYRKLHDAARSVTDLLEKR
jgi:hypothetical protein